MYKTRGKTYVIDVDDLRTPETQDLLLNTTGPPTPSPSRTGPGTRKVHTPGGTRGADDRRLRALVPFLLTFVLGPLAPLVMRWNRRNILWGGIGCTAGTLAILAVWRWEVVAGWLERGSVSIPAWWVFLVAAVLVWFAAWARAILHMRHDERLDPARLPGWFRDPGILGILGILVPGSGLYLAGHRRRAALAFVMMGPFLLTLFVLGNAGRIWSLNMAPAARGLPLETLEVLLLGTLLLGILCGVAWIGQALDGARLRAGQLAAVGTPRGDWFVLLLIAVIAVSSVTFDPTSLARDIDDLVISMRHEGYRLIPLYSATLASRLDPSEPLYVLRRAEIEEDLGRHQKARILRAELTSRWKEFDALMLRTAPLSEPEPQPEPSPPGRADLDLGPAEPPIL